MHDRAELTALNLLARLIAAHAGPAAPADVPASLPSLAIDEALWRGLLAEARRHKVEPLLAAALSAPGVELPASVEVRSALAADRRRVQITNLLLLDALAAVLAELHAAQIPALLLKGTALALTLYPTPALRPLGDIDLLVHPEHAGRAAAVLEQLGYAPVTAVFAEDPRARDTVAQGTGAEHGERSFVRRGRCPIVVDLHWRLLARAGVRRKMDPDWFWAQTTTIAVHAAPAHVFTPTAQLLHLCAHAWQHGRPTLRWSYDVALLLAQRTIDWELALAAAARFGLGLALQRTLAAVVQWWGVAPPPAVAAKVAALPTPVFARLLDRCATAGNWRGLIVLEGLAQRTPQAAARYWLQLLLPPHAYMRSAYAAQGRRELAACYAQRLGHGLLGLRGPRHLQQPVTTSPATAERGLAG